MLTVIKKLLGLKAHERPEDRTADHPERSIVSDPPIARSAMLRPAEKSETEAALDRATSKTE